MLCELEGNSLNYRQFSIFFQKKMRIIRISFSLLFNVPLQIFSIYTLYKYNFSIHSELELPKILLYIISSTILLHIPALVIYPKFSSKFIKESISRDVTQLIYCTVTVVNIVSAMMIFNFDRRTPSDLSSELIPQYRRIIASLKKICSFLELSGTVLIFYWTIFTIAKTIKKSRQEM